MKCRLLIGPAGSGKTHWCLEEVAGHLRESSDGMPLLYLTPKQATYQVERQLLQRAGVDGYTRLQILSFERLARFILEQGGRSIPRLVSEEVRVMALRALLHSTQPHLTALDPKQRPASLARQLSLLIREFQRSRIGPKALRDAATEFSQGRFLGRKLADVALLYERYQEWLREEELEDADRLPDLASEALEAGDSQRPSPPEFGGLWMDGFAEMTAQECSLLGSILPFCRQVTLAFCLGTDAKETADDLSMWSVTSHTFERCREMVESARLGAEVETVRLSNRGERKRFFSSPALAHLEKAWGTGESFTAEAEGCVDVIGCVDAEAELVVVAREILQHVKRGGRYHETSVIVRDLGSTRPTIERVFRRYGIPFFLDQRAPVSHHPVAELTRCALRIACWGWRHGELFALLKTGVATGDESLVDRLENLALAKGWDAEDWLSPIPANAGAPDSERSLEGLRTRVVGPLLKFQERLGQQPGPSGDQMAAAIRGLWSDFPVERTLATWSENTDPEHPELTMLHRTVWQAMQEWLDNLELVFRGRRLSLSEWIDVVEAGLESLTAGVVPPALEQVSVGAVDRSRLAEIRLAAVCGFSDDSFPKPPTAPGLLGDADVEALAERKILFGLTRRQSAAREHFLAYIALTRATERVVCTWSRLDDAGKARNPSPFARELARLFPHIRPALDPQSPALFDGVKDFARVMHASELAELAPLRFLHRTGEGDLEERLSLLPEAAELVRWRRGLREGLLRGTLDPSLLSRRHPEGLITSVSALEDFAACPFRYFARRTLRIEEREEFKADPRTRGELAHEILRVFHELLKAQGKRWRELSAEEAEDLVSRLGNELSTTFMEGLYAGTPDKAFEAEILVGRVARLVRAMVGWMNQQYPLDPGRAELAFGEGPEGLPALELSLNSGGRVRLRGRIDRVDWLRKDSDGGDGTEILVAVFDYKSRAQRITLKHLHNGLQLQLLTYLALLAKTDAALLGSPGARLKPIGAFYIPIQGTAPDKKSRSELFNQSAQEQRRAYMHRGMFDEEYAGFLDSTGNIRSNDQFAFHHSSKNKLSHEEFGKQLDHVLRTIESFSSRILAGEAEVAPYRDGASETACDDCDYNSVCRFDRMLQPYRALEKPHQPAKSTKPAGERIKRSKSQTQNS